MRNRLNIRWFRLQGFYYRSILLICFFAFILIFLYTDIKDSTDDTATTKGLQPESAAVRHNVHEVITAAVYNRLKLGNYEPKTKSNRTGLGEHGAAVDWQPHEKIFVDQSIAEFGFNLYLSDKISLDREIKDTRPRECKFWHYPEAKYLPTASVIIVFFNEGWSVVARTVHSVINTSPPELLKEVIMIDDHSTYGLYDNFTQYIKRWNGLVKIHRTSKREGLIKARVIGAKMAVGDVIVVLDAHCECVVNWLPPLLTRIAINRKTLAVPIVDGIEWETMMHTNIYGEGKASLKRGIWEWGFLYKETDVPEKELAKRTYDSEPYWSPTHAGGLLAIEKNWFFELGAYDDGIKIWGGEQYELSFKVWLCGGVVEWVPCSHVAHAYRGPRRATFPFPGALSRQTDRNHLRVSDIWMDEFKIYYRIREPAITKLDYGNISSQLELKKRLQCKPFKWFMDEIAYEMYEKFPLPPPNVQWGECRNVGKDVCLDQMGAVFGQKIGVSRCVNQFFRLNAEGEISSGEHCFHSHGKEIMKKFCLDSYGNWKPVGEWKYDNTTLQMISTTRNKCLDTDGSLLFLSACNPNETSQKWTWKNFYYD